MPRRERVAGVVLAAGRSTRMGRPKLALPLAGRPLVRHAVDAALAAGLAEVVVVLGADAAAVGGALAGADERVRVVVNPRPESGQGTSLRCGLAALGAAVDGAAVLLGDQPAVGARLIAAVVAAFRAGSAPIVRPVYGDGTPGHPVVLAREVWPAAAALRGDEGARALLAAHPDWLAAVAIDGPPPADVDTPDDYTRALRGAPAR